MIVLQLLRRNCLEPAPALRSEPGQGRRRPRPQAPTARSPWRRERRDMVKGTARPPSPPTQTWPGRRRQWWTPVGARRQGQPDAKYDSASHSGTPW